MAFAMCVPSAAPSLVARKPMLCLSFGVVRRVAFLCLHSPVRRLVRHTLTFLGVLLAFAQRRKMRAALMAFRWVSSAVTVRGFSFQ